MSTEKQKEAARRNIEKARQVQSERAHGEKIPSSSTGMSTAEKDRLAPAEFAFPEERKEPLTDAAHVRNAIARFDQVEGVTDEERDQRGGGFGRRPASTTSTSRRTIGATCSGRGKTAYSWTSVAR